MQKQTINQKDPEKEFILCKNVSGATQSVGAALYFDTASATDGFAVSAARTSQKFLFAGINDQALSNNSKGLVQTYGIRSAYMVLASTAVSAVPGDQLDAVASQAYLVKYVSQSIIGSSAAYTVDNAWNFVTLMDTFASAASAQSTPALKTVFIRAR
jgi:hypothetical protein